MEQLPSTQSHAVKGTPHCPCCDHEGRRVSAMTLESLLDAEARLRFKSVDGFWFCATPACDVAYFHSATGNRIGCAEVRVPIFQKRTEPERLVCYCFQHAVEAIQQEVRESGMSRIAADIKARCAQGMESCERTNPQGTCCLSNVQRVIREATGDYQTPHADEGACCCH